ncbi:hypothetical protein CU097_002193, partial [Rhizopus azygosporus]
YGRSSNFEEKDCDAPFPSVDDDEAITSNIVNIMLEENHLRYLYNFAVYFVFTAGIIFIKTASFGDPYDAFEAKININKIMKALDELETTWMNAARCSNILGELAGLRDIRLESNEYVPKKEAKQPTPPPAIAVPNSPENGTESESKIDKEWSGPKDMDLPLFNSTSQIPISSVRDRRSQSPPPSDLNGRQSSSPERSSLLDITPAMDPFAAPGIMANPAQQQQQQQQQSQSPFDPLSSAFWGMPTSLDTDAWNTYFGYLTGQNNNNNNNSNTPIASLLLSSTDDISSPVTSSSPFMAGTPKTESRARSSMLSNNISLDLPSSPSKSVLLGFLDNVESSDAENRPRGRPRAKPAAYISQLSCLHPLDLGRMDKRCSHCNALHGIDESEDRANNNSSAESGSPYGIISSSMRMHLIEGGVRRIHNLTTMEEVAAVVPIEYIDRNFRDIVLTLRSSSRNDSLGQGYDFEQHFQRISQTHASYVYTNCSKTKLPKPKNTVEKAFVIKTSLANTYKYPKLVTLIQEVVDHITQLVYDGSIFANYYFLELLKNGEELPAVIQNLFYNIFSIFAGQEKYASDSIKKSFMTFCESTFLTQSDLDKYARKGYMTIVSSMAKQYETLVRNYVCSTYEDRTVRQDLSLRLW